MTRYADPERCPDCQAPMAFGASRCPACGLDLEGPLAAQLFATLSTADDLLARMRASTAAATVPAPTRTATAAPPAPPVGGVDTLVRPRTTPVVAPPRGLPPRPPEHHGGLSGASVPKILLGLGALCLLVAALVFLAVTWSAMGVAGRTATLIGFTVVAGGLSAWAAHRDLRAASEALGVVALGLLTFDMFGAEDAGWFGDISTSGFFVLLGAAIAVVATSAALAVRRTPVGAFVGGEVFAGLGVASATGGLVLADWLAFSAALTLAVVLTAGVTVAALSVRLRALAVAAATVSALTWAVLLFSSWDRATANPSLGELWGELEVWPLLAAAVLVGALAVVRRLPLEVRLVALSVAVLVLVGVAVAPFTDESATALAAAGAVVVVVVAALTWVVAQPWRRSLGALAGLGVLSMLTVALPLGVLGLARIVRAGDAQWSGSVGDAFPTRVVSQADLASWLLPVAVAVAALALVALARSFTWAERPVAPLLDPVVAAAAGAATLALTLTLLPVAMWLVSAVLLAAVAGFTVVSVRRGQALSLVLASVFLAVAIVLALHAEGLMLATLLVGLVSALAVHLRWKALEVSVGAGALVAGGTAALVWTIGALADAPAPWTAVVALLVLAALVLGGPYVDTRIRVSGPATYARLGAELGGLVAATVVGFSAVDLAAPSSQQGWAAVYLTLAGATGCAMALLRVDRRLVGWLGGALLVLASWVRLAELGVGTPEAYTLPAAVALVVVGLVHLRQEPRAGSMPALIPGLVLALVPSLLWVFADPISLRALLLGVACLGLVLGGIRLRWSAPVVLGALVGTLLVVRLAVPVVEPVPRWALIGAAGVLLVVVGITWEKRVREARRLAGYVRGLR